jgi:ABC-type spermidine/putrescine transport system permease subunit II
MAEAGAHMSRLVATIYACAVYTFIFLPVGMLILFSFQGGQVPVPPFNGPSLKWYRAVLADEGLTSGLTNSLIVALLSSAVATVIGFLAAWGFARYTLEWILEGLDRFTSHHVLSHHRNGTVGILQLDRPRQITLRRRHRPCGD